MTLPYCRHWLSLRTMIARALLLIMLLMINGCVVGPNYVPPEPVVPDDWQNLLITHNLSDEGFVQSFGTIGSEPTLGQGKYTLTNEECPWGLSFLDDDLIKLIDLQRAQSPTLHEFRAAVDQAWHQRWVLKRGAYPHIELRSEHFQFILDQDFRSAGSRTHDNVYRADIGWEIDMFGGIQRQVEVADRNLESQVESWRNAVLFFAGEIGLFYTDLRVNEHRIELQKQNIEFYEEVVQLVQQKVEFGGTAKIDLEEAQARLEKERQSMPIQVHSLTPHCCTKINNHNFCSHWNCKLFADQGEKRVVLVVSDPSMLCCCQTHADGRL